MGWTDLGLKVIRDEFDKLRKFNSETQKHELNLRTVKFQSDNEEGLLMEFLMWCKKDC
jgi:hypothetical protein